MTISFLLQHPNRPSSLKMRSSATPRPHHHHHHHPLRTAVSSASRPKPYEKPPPSIPNPSSAKSDGKWTHDLFEPDSNLYGPKIRFNVNDLHSSASHSPIPVSQPSPSLRPFGNSSAPTPAPTPTHPVSRSLLASATPISSPATLPQPLSANAHPSTFQPSPSATTPSAGLSLLSRIQSDPSQRHLFPTPTPIHPPSLNNSRIPSKSSRSNELHDAQELKNQNIRTQKAFDAAMAKYLSGPVILEVANLADGTSAEDVKTAFADFGEIQECSTQEGPKQGNQQTLKAKMVFTNKSEADKAVEALNGALADGLTLAVKIVGRPSKKPERGDFMILPQAEVVQPMSTVDVTMKAPTEDVRMNDAQELSTPAIVPTGRLRSEVVAQCDPRASLQSEPQRIPIYHAKPDPPVPTMIQRVQPLSKQARHHHSNPSPLPQNLTKSYPSPRLHQNQSSKSLLARIGRA